jgi:hypothetical protein
MMNTRKIPVLDLVPGQRVYLNVALSPTDRADYQWRKVDNWVLSQFNLGMVYLFIDGMPVQPVSINLDVTVEDD